MSIGTVVGLGALSNPTGPNREPRIAARLSFTPRRRQRVELASFLCIGQAPSAFCGHVHAGPAAAGKGTQGIADASTSGVIWQTSQTPTIGPKARRRRVITRST
jgi:hypothetical protein